MIQRVMLSGEFGIDSPARVGRSATLLSGGPMTPLAPWTPGTVWQPPQPLATTRARPFSGLPGTPAAGVRIALDASDPSARGVGIETGGDARQPAAERRSRMTAPTPTRATIASGDPGKSRALAGLTPRNCDARSRPHYSQDVSAHGAASRAVGRMAGGTAVRVRDYSPAMDAAWAVGPLDEMVGGALAAPRGPQERPAT